MKLNETEKLFKLLIDNKNKIKFIKTIEKFDFNFSRNQYIDIFKYNLDKFSFQFPFKKFTIKKFYGVKYEMHINNNIYGYNYKNNYYQQLTNVLNDIKSEYKPNNFKTLKLIKTIKI